MRDTESLKWPNQRLVSLLKEIQVHKMIWSMTSYCPAWALNDFYAVIARVSLMVLRYFISDAFRSPLGSCMRGLWTTSSAQSSQEYFAGVWAVWFPIRRICVTRVIHVRSLYFNWIRTGPFNLKHVDYYLYGHCKMSIIVRTHTHVWRPIA